MKSIYFKTALIILTGCCIIFAILYFRMCFILNGLSGRVAEKKIALIETRRMFEKNAEEQSSRMALLQSRFHLVDATDAEDPNTAFQQKTVDKEDKSLVASLSAHVRNPDFVTPESLQKIFISAQNAGVLLPEKLIIDSESGRVIDCNAAVLEEFCRRFHLEARTSLLWNLRQMKRGFVTEIFSPDHPNFKTVTVYSESLLLPESHFSKDLLSTDGETETGENAINAAASGKDAAVSVVEHAGQSLTEETNKDFADANDGFGKKNLPSSESAENSRDNYDTGWPQHPDIALLRKSICHDRLETFVFPFDLNILTGKQRDVVLPGCEIPLGGLYLHYFSVYCPETWQLCYEFPEEADLEHAGIRLVNLLAGSSVSYELKGTRLTVKILPDEYHRSAFLLTADHLMIPQSAYAQIEGFFTKKIDFSQ